MNDFLFEQDKTGGLNTGQDCRTSHLDRTELEAKRQDRTAGLPIWTGQDWRAGDRTVLQDFTSEQDRTGGQETGQDCRSYCLNRTGLEGRKQDSTTKLPIWTGQNWRARDRTGLQDFAYRLDRNGGQ